MILGFKRGTGFLSLHHTIDLQSIAQARHFLNLKTRTLHSIFHTSLPFPLLERIEPAGYRHDLAGHRAFVDVVGESNHI